MGRVVCFLLCVITSSCSYFSDFDEKNTNEVYSYISSNRLNTICERIRNYQNITYASLLSEVDSNQIEKKKIRTLKELFYIRNKALDGIEEEQELNKIDFIYERFLKKCDLLGFHSMRSSRFEDDKSKFNGDANYYKKYKKVLVILTIEDCLDRLYHDVNT